MDTNGCVVCWGKGVVGWNDARNERRKKQRREWWHGRCERPARWQMTRGYGQPRDRPAMGVADGRWARHSWWHAQTRWLGSTLAGLGLARLDKEDGSQGARQSRFQGAILARLGSTLARLGSTRGRRQFGQGRATGDGTNASKQEHPRARLALRARHASYPRGIARYRATRRLQSMDDAV